MSSITHQYKESRGAAKNRQKKKRLTKDKMEEQLHMDQTGKRQIFGLAMKKVISHVTDTTEARQETS